MLLPLQLLFLLLLTSDDYVATSIPDAAVVDDAAAAVAGYVALFLATLFVPTAVVAGSDTVAAYVLTFSTLARTTAE